MQALLVTYQWQDSPILLVLPVVRSFMQQHGRIPEDIRNQMHPNIQSILFRSPTSRNIVLPDTTVEALVAFSW
ncbi:hypothetical protein M413DRAFT_440648 [Hebeloma cylindrosporum]|uniref:Uncharacterized protein n=1 Tax=Hebeloma cylindrosporum TaxID=76867 RepID=A0A0C2Z1R5_HEBCY|nr:hypothetical protein M413DRAFT_440648 [Hebeloma cylindrosporum h7]